MNQQLASLHQSWKFSDNIIKNPVVVQQIIPEQKKAKVVFSFYQADFHADDPHTVILDPIEGGVAKFSIIAMVTGNVTAEDLHIWIRACSKCKWISSPPIFRASDQDHELDRELYIPKIESNIALGKWDFSVAIPKVKFPRYSTIQVGGFYACENCDTVDWNKPQRLFITKNAMELSKLQFQSPSISDIPEPVH